MPKAAIERADRQTAPLIEGRFYLVPTVRAAWCGEMRDWPVFGPLHEDREIFKFPYDHYHIDPRFLPRRFSRINRVFRYGLYADVMFEGRGPLPVPVLKRRKCIRSAVPFSPPWEHATEPLLTLRRMFAGHRCAKGKSGFICPHRNAVLGSIAAEHGVLTCPLHGLRIDAASGVVLPEGEAGHD